MRLCYVLDVIGIKLRGYLKERAYTTPWVLKEIKNELLSEAVKGAVAQGLLRVREVRKEFLEKAREEARETGDLASLSEADLSLIGLALELREEGEEPVIFTNDFSIQNVASSLGLSYVAPPGRAIRFSAKWILKCPECGIKIPLSSDLNRCPECGSPLRRVLLRRRLLKDRGDLSSV